MKLGGEDEVWDISTGDSSHVALCIPESIAALNSHEAQSSEDCPQASREDELGSDDPVCAKHVTPVPFCA